MKTRYALIFLVLILGTSQAHLAQDAEAPAPDPWVQLSIVQVEPTMIGEFLAVQRELTGRAREAKTAWRTVSRTAVFGDPHRFLIATPAENLAAFDQRAETTSELASLTQRLDRAIRSQQTYAVRTLPDIDNPPPADQEPALMVVNVATVTPGREQDYYRIMKSDFLPHFDEAEVPHLSGAIAFGGDGGYIHFFYYDNFAELDAGSPVMQALGPAGAADMLASFSGVVSSSEMWLTRLIPDLSFGPWSEEPEEPGR